MTLVTSQTALSVLGLSLVAVTFIQSLPVAGMPFDVLESDLEGLEDVNTDDKLISRPRKRDVYVTFEDRAQSICIGLCMYYDMKPYDKCLDRCRLDDDITEKPTTQFELGGDWYGREAGGAAGETSSPPWVNVTRPPGGGGQTTAGPKGPPFYGTYTYNIYNPRCHPRHKVNKQDYLARLKEEWLEKLRNESQTKGDAADKNIFTIYSGSAPNRKIHKGIVIYRERMNNNKVNATHPNFDRDFKQRRPHTDRGYHLEGVHVHIHKPKDSREKDRNKDLVSTPPTGQSTSTATLSVAHLHIVSHCLPFIVSLCQISLLEGVRSLFRTIQHVLHTN